jgi:periplasmic divalent cation tolerance protein
MSELSVVLVTAPDLDTAARLARALVEERLAACGNLVPGVRSIYRWQGAVHDEAEVLVVLKTRRDAVEALRARVVALHPYECPEVVALSVGDVHPPYLAWVLGEVGTPQP